MSFEFKTFSVIVTGNLKPWLADTRNDQFYKNALADVESSYYTSQPLYELAFTKSLSPKRDYYLRLIDNEAIDYLNEVNKKMQTALSEDSKIYTIHVALQNSLPSKLNKIARTITDQGYAEIHYKPSSKPLKTDILLSDGSYIFEYLKHSFVRLYLEIQDRYKEFVKNDIYNIEDLYVKYFDEPEPEAAVIIEAQQVKVKSIQNFTQNKAEDVKFKQITSDFRPDSKGILDYKHIVKNPARFATFEESLFTHGYIDINYNYTNEHGKKNELAMIYHYLITKGYFNKRTFSPNKSIKDLDVRKFLDHRYATNVDKQFRNYIENREKIADFVESQFWLFNLPSS